MKTWEFSQALVIKSSEERLNIVCGRQFQTSVSQSVKHSIEEHISRLELDDEFSIQNEQIIQKLTVDTWGHPDCPYTWVELQEGARWSVPEEPTLEERMVILENKVDTLEGQ